MPRRSEDPVATGALRSTSGGAPSGLAEAQLIRLGSTSLSGHRIEAVPAWQLARTRATSRTMLSNRIIQQELANLRTSSRDPSQESRCGFYRTALVFAVRPDPERARHSISSTTRCSSHPSDATRDRARSQTLITRPNDGALNKPPPPKTSSSPEKPTVFVRALAHIEVLA